MEEKKEFSLEEIKEIFLMDENTNNSLKELFNELTENRNITTHNTTDINNNEYVHENQIPNSIIEDVFDDVIFNLPHNINSISDNKKELQPEELVNIFLIDNTNETLKKFFNELAENKNTKSTIPIINNNQDELQPKELINIFLPNNNSMFDINNNFLPISKYEMFKKDNLNHYSYLCIHNRTKRRCLICNPHFKCKHGKDKYTCLQCRPELKCEHNKLKKECLFCSSHLKCEHNKLKRRCTFCRTELRCIHNKLKNQCFICRPELKCEHNKLKYKCLICNAHLKCIHGITKYGCLNCNPELKCIHGKKKGCKLCVALDRT